MELCLIHRTTPSRSWLRLVGDASPQSHDREGAVDPQERDDVLEPAVKWLLRYRPGINPKSMAGVMGLKEV